MSSNDIVKRLMAEARDSMRINLKTGEWSDSATGKHGSDLISLYAHLNGVNYEDAAIAICKQLGTSVPRIGD